MRMFDGQNSILDGRAWEFVQTDDDPCMQSIDPLLGIWVIYIQR